jgi:hypothetical protein
MQTTRPGTRAASMCFGPSPTAIRASSFRLRNEITDSVSSRVFETKQRRPPGPAVAQPHASATPMRGPAYRVT